VPRTRRFPTNTLNKRLRLLGYDTSSEHTGHGFRTVFSTLLNGETDRKTKAKMWDGDVIELQLAHLDESTVRAIYNRQRAEAFLETRALMMQAWADRIDGFVRSSAPVPMVRKKEEVEKGSSGDRPRLHDTRLQPGAASDHPNLVLRSVG